MNRMHFNTFAALAAVVLVALSAQPLEATEFQVGIGTSFTEDPAKAITEAFDEAYGKFGQTGRAKLVLVMENCTSARNAREARSMIFEKAKGLPVYGACMGNAGYVPLSADKGFLKKRGITVMVLGGDFEFQAEMVEMGKVTYPNNRDRKENPEKFKKDYQTLIDNRQKPGAELGKKLKFGPDKNLLVILGQLHNPEIRFFANGLKESIPEEVTVIGGATQGGCTYFKDKTFPSAALGLRISGKFQIVQDMQGSFWDGKDLPKHLGGILETTAVKGVPKPDLLIGFLCASWQRGPMDEQHKALVAVLGKDAPLFGSYSGGEMGKHVGRDKTKTLTGGGAFGVVVAIKGEK